MAGPFELALSDFAKKAGDQSDRVVRQVVLEVGSRVVARSPVDKGRFHANWFYGEGAPPVQTTDAGTPELHGAPTPEGAAETVHYIANNLPYGPTIEYGLYPNPPKGGKGRTIGGFSTQAPQGVVGLTVLEFSGIVDGAAAQSR